MENFQLPIILIGPISTGKSTIADLLQQKLNINKTPVDWIRYYYYFKSGLDLTKADNIRKEKPLEWLEFMRPYELDCVENILKDDFCKQSIIEFGGGHSYYTKPEEVMRFKEAMANIQNIFLILPDKDIQVSKKVLSERIDKQLKEEGVTDLEKALHTTSQMNELFLHSELNTEVAKNIVYTNNKSMEEVIDEIIKKLK